MSDYELMNAPEQTHTAARLGLSEIQKREDPSGQFVEDIHFLSGPMKPAQQKNIVLLCVSVQARSLVRSRSFCFSFLLPPQALTATAPSSWVSRSLERLHEHDLSTTTWRLTAPRIPPKMATSVLSGFLRS